MEIADVNGGEDLLAIVAQANVLIVDEQRVHVLKAGLLFLLWIHLAFCLFFALLHLGQPINWRVVDLLDFVYCNDSHHWPVQTE